MVSAKVPKVIGLEVNLEGSEHRRTFLSCTPDDGHAWKKLDNTLDSGILGDFHQALGPDTLIPGKDRPPKSDRKMFARCETTSLPFPRNLAKSFSFMQRITLKANVVYGGPGDEESRRLIMGRE